MGEEKKCTKHWKDWALYREERPLDGSSQYFCRRSFHPWTSYTSCIYCKPIITHGLNIDWTLLWYDIFFLRLEWILRVYDVTLILALNGIAALIRIFFGNALRYVSFGCLPSAVRMGILIVEFLPVAVLTPRCKTWGRTSLKASTDGRKSADRYKWDGSEWNSG